jgi:hypothetical protein
MQYHNFIINLFEEPMTTQLEQPENKDQVKQTLQKPPREILWESKSSTEILIRLYYLRHGFEANNAFMVQNLSLLAFTTMAAIQAGNYPGPLDALRSTIVLAAMGLRDQSHSHYLGQLVFNAVRGGMGTEEVALIDRILGQGRKVGKNPPKEWHAQSIWAVDLGSITENVEKRRLSNLLKNAERSRHVTEVAE